MKIDERTGIVEIDDNIYHLTRTEMKVLVKLKKNRIITYEEIYHILYNIKVDKLSINDRCGISTIISRIKKKTNLVIKSYYGYGYELGGTNGKI